MEDQENSSQKFSFEEIEELIESLQGTTDTVNSTINEVFGEDYSENDLTDDDWNRINNSIFLCTDCGWWCEISDATEENNDGEEICQDCNEIR